MDEQIDLLGDKRNSTMNAKDKDASVRQTMVSSREEVHSLLDKARENRKVGATQANDVSSRSHFLF